MRIHTFTVLIGATVLAAALPTGAQSARSKTANLQVTAEVIGNCIMEATDIPFGPYDPISKNLTQPLRHSARISAKCTPGTAVKVEIDDGLHATGPQLRAMANAAGQHLMYDMTWYKHGKPNGPVGRGANAWVDVADQNAAGWILAEIMAAVPAGQRSAGTGNYADTLLATISF